MESRRNAICRLLSLFAIAALALPHRYTEAQPWAGPGGPGSGGIGTLQSAPVPNGTTVHMPLKLSVSRKSGLEIYVDSRWANSYGYRPFEITVNSPAPSTSDHLITIQLHTGSASELSVVQDFEVPTARKSVTTTIDVPSYEPAAHYFWFDVWVDGEKDADLSVDESHRFVGGGMSAGTSNVTMLTPGPPSNHKSLYSTGLNDLELLSLNLADFPQKWIEYTALDVVALRVNELSTLANEHPTSFEAIRQWTRAGGQLWIYDIGNEWERLPRVSKLFQLSEALDVASLEPNSVNSSDKNQTEAANAEIAPKVGWRPLRYRGGRSDGRAITFKNVQTGAEQVLRDPAAIAALKSDPNFIATNPQTEVVDDTFERRWPRDSSELFVEQRLGLGLVRAFRAGNAAVTLVQAQSGTPADWTMADESNNQAIRALALAVRSTRRWENRHGLTPDSASREFAYLLVPDVGLAPVLEFQILITLFVVLIGPVNYWLLRRYKRLFLLVITVPLAAAVTTASLFAYAIISDGFGTTVRVRSFTALDQRTGEAACWSRVSLYAGLAPAKGLILPAGAAVYPILANWNQDSNRIKREMIWGDNELRLSSGWLNSRTPTQYLTIRARNTPARLDVQQTAGEKMRVTNRLGATVTSLVIFDEAGRFYAGDQIEANVTAELAQISRANAVKSIFQQLRDNEAKLPDRLSGSDREWNVLSGRPGRRGYSRMVPPQGGGQLSDNLASRALSDLAGLNGRPALELTPKSYVAITETAPEVVSGIPNAQEAGSFHVIVGQW
jgi:hypothetical protein